MNSIRVSRFALCILTLTAIAGCATTKPKPTNEELAKLLLQVADATLAEGDPTGALQNLLLAEARDPNLAQIHHSKALAYDAKKDLPDAIASARKAVDLAPDYAEANNTLGKLLIDAGNLDEAVGPLERAAKNPIYRGAYKAQTNLGILRYRQGNYAEARTCFNQAIEGNGNSACIAYYYRGHLDLRGNHFTDAISDYDKASRKFCAGFKDADFALGVAYERAHDYNLARRQFVEIEKRYPDSPFADQAVNHLKNLP